MNSLFERALIEEGVISTLTREYRLYLSFALLKELQESLLVPLNKLNINWSSQNVGPEMVAVSFNVSYRDLDDLEGDIIINDNPFNSDYRSLEIELNSSSELLAAKFIDIPKENISGMLHNVQKEAEWIVSYPPFLDELEDIYHVCVEYGEGNI